VNPLGGRQRGRVVVLPGLRQGVCPGDVLGLGLVPPFVLVHRGQGCAHGCPVGGLASLQFVRGPGVLLLALAQGFLTRTCECLREP
jgi:hypothetical protein